ncbi:MAG TPA: sulfurtransferase [Thermoanaerobaculia bacterium]|nr:sulfurtransferase [Thermoanaerobaculia bacterium]
MTTPAPLSTPLLAPEDLTRWLLDPDLAGAPVRLLDARPGAAGREAYETAHLSGALHVDLDRDLAAIGPDPAIGGRHPLPPVETWRARLGSWGITPEHHVVVYDAQGGANAAARVWWMLRAVGHRATSLLDGGWQAAREAGVPIDSTEPTVRATAPYPAAGWLLPLADFERVDAARLDAGCRVVDVRSERRYRGQIEPFDPIAGHIPGAINLPYERALGPDGRMLPRDALRALFAPLAEVPPERVIVHCGSGVTACHTLLALDAAGIEVPALYVGSWSEWCRADRPLARETEADVAVDGDAGPDRA